MIEYKIGKGTNQKPMVLTQKCLFSFHLDTALLNASNCQTPDSSFDSPFIYLFIYISKVMTWFHISNFYVNSGMCWSDFDDPTGLGALEGSMVYPVLQGLF